MTSRVLSALSLCLLVGMAACGGNKDDGEDTTVVESGLDTNLDTGEEDVLPYPFTLDFTGSLEQSLLFDAPNCTLNAPTHLQVFWRNLARDHTFVLVAEILGGVASTGSYDQNTTGARLKLQEEAGGSGAYYQSDASQGDTFIIEITEHNYEEGYARGTFSFSALHSGSDATTATPMPIPIYCGSS